MASNAVMATSSLDRTSGTATAPLTQPYNNFRVQTRGANLIQGQVNSVRVAEIYFPYEVPTVVENKNDALRIVYWETDGTAITSYDVVAAVNGGWYNESEMQDAVQEAIDDALVGEGSYAAGDLTVTLDVAGRLSFLNNTTADAPPAISKFFFVYPQDKFTDLPASNANLFKPTLIWTLGLRALYANIPLQPYTGPQPAGWNNGVVPICLVPEDYVNVAPIPGFEYPYFANPKRFARIMSGSVFTGRYTDWIDITSPVLCQNQYVRDSNTNQEVVRKDVVARLYIADEVSTFQDYQVGSRPFIIHRQFKNPKFMKWTAERSIDSIDLQLFDMWGEPLPAAVPYVVVAQEGQVQPGFIPEGQYAYNGPNDYAITFLVNEAPAGKQGENVGYGRG